MTLSGLLKEEDYEEEEEEEEERESERETEELLSALNYLQRHFLLNVRKKTTGK